MSDPDEDWGLEWDLVPTVGWDTLETISICRVADWWLRQTRDGTTRTILRASDLNGDWSVVQSGTEYRSSVFAENGVAACWVNIDDEFFLRWSDDGFSTYTDRSLPPGWVPLFYTIDDSSQLLKWDGERWGVLLLSDAVGQAVAYTTDLASAFTINSTSQHETAYGNVSYRLNGAAGSPWSWTAFTTSYDGLGITTLLTGDNFAATWSASAIPTGSYDLSDRIGFWNGQQAAILDPTDAGKVRISDTPAGPYTLVTDAVPDGFIPVTTFTGFSAFSDCVRWDPPTGLWVIAGQYGYATAIAVTPDLGQPWQLVEVEDVFGVTTSVTSLDKQQGEWFLTVQRQSLGRSAVLFPGLLGGAGWEIVL